MANEKFTKFVFELERKTREGGVRWERTSDESVYQAAFPKYLVRVYPKTHRGGVEPNYFIAILSENGSLIEEKSDTELAESWRGESGVPVKLMQRLYETAKEKATGIEGALDSLLGYLK
ncbi:MAG: hypothetical protein FJZ95_06585 [Chloroflexi bacterium]|nr:hypothetical protein [Chloroflexota bacterium]